MEKSCLVNYIFIKLQRSNIIFEKLLPGTVLQDLANCLCGQRFLIITNTHLKEKFILFSICPVSCDKVFYDKTLQGSSWFGPSGGKLFLSYFTKMLVCHTCRVLAHCCDSIRRPQSQGQDTSGFRVKATCSYSEVVKYRCSDSDFGVRHQQKRHLLILA